MPVGVTAGHVDHGKSTLVRPLTGTDPDRLAEEKRRGLTIDLGFATAELGPGLEVGFVDAGAETDSAPRSPVPVRWARSDNGAAHPGRW